MIQAIRAFVHGHQWAQAAIIIGFFVIVGLVAGLIRVYKQHERSTSQISSEQHILNNMDNFSRTMQVNPVMILDEVVRPDVIAVFNGQSWQAIRQAVSTAGVVMLCQQADGTYVHCADEATKLCLLRLYVSLNRAVNTFKLDAWKGVVAQSSLAEMEQVLEECRP